MCPFVNHSTVCAPHTQASREALTKHLKAINNVSISSSPSKDLFLKTFTYFTALKWQGCGSPLVEETQFLGDEKSKEDLRLHSRNEKRRGHAAKITCQGRVIIDYATSGHLFVWSVTPMHQPAGHSSRPTYLRWFADANITVTPAIKIISLTTIQEMVC